MTAKHRAALARLQEAQAAAVAEAQAHTVAADAKASRGQQLLGIARAQAEAARTEAGLQAAAAAEAVIY
jgi:hypothetical protein